MCSQFEYTCYFEKHPRKRSKIVEKDAVENGLIAPPTSHARPAADETQREGMLWDERQNPEELSKLRSMEANSGIAFTKLLGMRLDPSAGPKLFTFGYNLGTVTRTSPPVSPITELLTESQLLATSTAYFEYVHVLFGILDRDRTTERIRLRYSSREPVKQCPDHLLGGIAALGSLFAPGEIDEAMPSIIDATKLSLESSSMVQPPALCDVQAWILRTIYLRFSGHPHACWLSTSITMHLIESIGLHQESSSVVIYSPACEHPYDPELRRRAFWIARMLNTWVSVDYGRSRVALHGITCKLPTARDGDLSRELLGLYSISCALDPDLLDKPGQWEDFLHQLETFETSHDTMELSKAHLAFCAYRRLRLNNPNLPAHTTNRIISLGLKGLQAARNLAKSRKPWWHVANVPFQTICVFLAMDSRESLLHLTTALRTLEHVVDLFATQSMKEALKTARFLIRLSKRKKDEDSEVLGQSLRRELTESELPPDGVPPPTDTDGVTQIPGRLEAPMTTSSGEDWNLDYLNNSDFDWNFFLSQDFPAFHQFAPDGLM